MAEREKDTMWAKMSRVPKEQMAKEMLAAELSEEAIGEDSGISESDSEAEQGVNARPVLPLSGSLNAPTAKADANEVPPCEEALTY